MIDICHHAGSLGCSADWTGHLLVDPLFNTFSMEHMITL